MAGSIKKIKAGSKDRWRLRWREGSGGRAAPARSKTFDTLREAKEYQATLGVRSATRIDAKAAKVTFEAFRKAWLEALWKQTEASGKGLRQIAPNTVGNYEYASSLLLPALGSLSMADIRAGHCEQALLGLQAKTAPSTIRLVRAAGRRLFQHAVSHGLMGEQPMPSGKTFRLAVDRARGRRAPSYVTAEVVAMANAARSEAMGLAIMLLASLGLRRGELLALRWCDLELSDKLHCTVAGSVVTQSEPTGKRTVVHQAHGKTEAAQRSFPLSRWEATLFQQLKHDQTTMARQKGLPWTPTAYCFPDTGTLHTPMHPDKFSHRLFRLRDKLEIDRAISPVHGLRHYAIRALMKANVPLATIAKRVGHGSTALTLDVYTDPDDEDLSAASAALDARWGKISKGEGD